MAFEYPKNLSIPGKPIEKMYAEGDLVVERAHPHRKLKIIRYSHRLYHCRIIASPELADLALAERDIKPID